MKTNSRFAARDLDQLRQVAHPLTSANTDHDALLATVGDVRFVLLGALARR